MSEELLKAIIKLFVIVAKEEGEVFDSEKEFVKEFLFENISKEESNQYLKILDHLISKVSTGDDDKSQIRELAKHINKELTQSQKLVVMLRLVELIVADDKITYRETELLSFTGKCFHFDEKSVLEIKNFVTSSKTTDFFDECSLIVDDTPGDRYATKHIKLDGLNGFFAFFHVPGIEIYFFKYVGDDAIRLNGHHIKSDKIKTFSNGSSIMGKKTSRIYYSDVITTFREEAAETNISFVADSIHYKFKNGKVGLVNINIFESSGKLFGIMGGSGAGKSTLFNVLSGTAEPTSGTVRINGMDIYNNRKEIEGIIGFVPQDDLLIEDLTVYQNLYYAAKLCFSKSSKEELGELVNKTIDSLGLTEPKHLRVGNPLQKTISGGQRKRLNIGLELLRQPCVLFVDEPTSGLSSRDSENIMDLLKELSLRGKMVFITIHQPSSDIFKMFDKLVILDVGGHQIYYGNPIEAITYFKRTVDMIDKDQDACIECGNVNPERIFNIIEMKVVDEYGKFTNKRKNTARQWYKHFLSEIDVKREKEEEEVPVKNLSIPGKFRQIQVFLKRDVLAKINNQQYVIINLLEAPVLALLLTLITRYAPAGREYSFYENENIPIFFFMSIIVSLFMGLTVSAEEIIKDRKILKREAFLNLNKFSYLSSKMLILFGLSALQTLLFVLIGSWVLEIRGMTLSYWFILFSVSCFANVLGLNISSGFNSVITVYIIIPLLIIPQLILSGVVVSFDKLSGFVAHEEHVPLIGELMASRWAFEALAVTQFKDNPYNRKFYELDREIAQNTFKSIYYTKYLLDELEFCYRDRIHEKVPGKLTLIQMEIKKMLIMVSGDKFPQLDQLTQTTFTDQLYDETKAFLNTMHLLYNKRRNVAKQKLNEKMQTYSASPESATLLAIEKRTYVNDRISYMLKNIGNKRRIVEADIGLIQKIYPVYARNENPDHPFDFRADFYHPEKYFLGMYMDTLYFNVIVLWLMTIILFVALYYDWLRKLVSGKRK